jgi:hypothetical protein
MQARFAQEWAAGVLFVLVALPAAAFLYLALQVRPEAGAPPAFRSTLLVAGLLLAVIALFRLAEVLGADDTGSAATLTWIFAVFGAVALWASVRERSAIAGFVAAVSFGASLLAAWEWLFEPGSVTPFRWLLMLLAVVYVLASLVLRGSSPRQSELLVSAAGLAVLAIAATEAVGLLVPFAGGGELPNFWELVLVVSGCGLLAYAAADKVAGPAYVGVAVLGAFAALSTGSDATLLWWPLLLGLLGLGVLAAGLRPRSPLPPQPDAYGAGDLPLAARSREEETVIRVRDDS